ncbi:MAG: response regulator [Patescibacteria group bacterium]
MLGSTCLGGRPAILVVDDQPEIADFLKACLDRKGDYFVAIAYEGDFALSVLSALKIDIMISDQDMPGLTGLELTKKARLIQPGIKIILHTGSPPNDVLCRASGITEVLQKPVVLAVLYEAIEKLLKKPIEKTA